MAFGWEDVVAFGLGLPGTELSTAYRKPALKVGGKSFAATGHEPDLSFVLQLPIDAVELALTVAPDIFYQTPHYVGWPAMLVRYGADFAEVRDWIVRAHAARSCPPPAKRRRSRLDQAPGMSQKAPAPD